MAVRIRMTRQGRRNRPHYRVGVFDGRTPPDGKMIENLGTYDPHGADDASKVVLKKDRVEYWLSKGAKPTETVASLLKKQGVLVR